MAIDINPDLAPKEEVTPEVENPAAEVIDYSGKTLSELSELFQNFATSEDRLSRSKEAEALKSAFYKTLAREREKLLEGAEDVFVVVEENFKALYGAYKKERAAFNREQDAMKEDNLKLKLQVIEDLKNLLDKDEDVSATFPEFRSIQDRWKAIGAVPVQNFRDVNNTYQLYVEQFYDKLKINRELRDLDFKKNLEVKTELCEKAEKLAEGENTVEAFRELQKLHDAWKDLGPVAKQYREEIWERFKAATAVVNKKYQAYFEGMKGQQEDNLAAKTELCEKVEAIAAQEITDSRQWNVLSKEIESLQGEWRKIGYATRKENQKIYDRFRAACDQFFTRKRDFYSEFKGDLEENMKKKIALCEQAEQLKLSTDWKKATDEFIELQKQWKEIGAVPRKKSEAVWKRFRAACDEFFASKSQAKPVNEFQANLKAKRAVIEKIAAFVPTGSEKDDLEAMNAFTAEYNAIGFVPFKEKDKLAADFKAALAKAFPGMTPARARGARVGAKVLSEKEQLVAKYHALEQEIATKENNILFFAASKGNALLDQMRDSIEQAKADLQALEEKIRNTED